MPASPAISHLKWYNDTVRQLLTKEELHQLMQKSDWRGALEVAYIWCWIFFAFFIAWYRPGIITIPLALIILGGKQLACAIIMHDTSHKSLFRSSFLNEFTGQWLGAYPIMLDMKRYRPYHLQHHITTGTDDDPDISLTKGYPTTAWSMFRKFLRDMSGVTGIKGQIAVLGMHLGYIKFELGGKINRLRRHTSTKEMITSAIRNLAGPLCAQIVLFAMISFLFDPWIYLLWIGSLLTTYNWSLRVRSIAEHSCVPDRNDPHLNTRTIYASWPERMLFAPLYVNFHAEHHLLMAAPPYAYPKLHSLLKERGYFQKGLIEKGYWNILRMAIKGKDTYPS